MNKEIVNVKADARESASVASSALMGAEKDIDADDESLARYTYYDDSEDQE